MAKQNSRNGAWLFLGPELGEKQAAIDEIRKSLSLGGAPEETVYYAGDTPVSVMVAEMRNGSLFADKRLFFIKSAEVIKKKEDIDSLSAFIAAPPEDSCLILVSEENGVAKGLEKGLLPGHKKTFWELSDAKKSDWVGNFFRREGFIIGREGIETILELVPNNTAALKQECSRLTLFLDKDREITGADAEKWLSHTREESAFTLFSRIASGDLQRSLESARILFAAKEAPPAIFAGLASCFKKMAAYIALKDSGVNDEMEYRKIGVSAPGAKRDYAAAAKRYNSAAAENCLALTAEYDLLLRSALSFPEQILFDQYLLKIHSLGNTRAP